MINIRFFVMIATAAISVSVSHACSAYSLLPTPQKIPYQGAKFKVNPKKIVISSAMAGHDKRVINSLKKVFPDAVVSKDRLPGAAGVTVVYAVGAADKITKELCTKMKCSDVKPDAIPPQGYFLGIRKTPKGNIILILFKDAYGEFYATKTLRQLYENGELPEISIYDWPDFKVRGVLEGFYGKPWPAESRDAMIPWLADYKFNIYIYAPKDDYKLRLGWRISFTEKELARVKATNELAADNFVTYCWELSPGINVVYSKDKDVESALKKFRAIIIAGAKCVALAFDDVGLEFASNDRGKFKTYQEGQMDFSNKVAGRLFKEFPEVMVSFVPNDYWGALAAESEYLRYVGKHLDPRVQIGYTGNEIVPQTVTGSDVRYYEYYIKRKPILGDNYPVSDYVNQGGRLSLGPLRGRDPSLFRYVAGFVSNAMPLPESSKPALLTISEYVWNPFKYDPDESWARAMDTLGGGKKGGDTLLFYAKQSESSVIWKQDALDLFEATRGLLRGFKKLPDYDFAEYRAETEKIFRRYAGINAEIEALRNPGNEAMLKEMRPWIDKMSDYGAIGLDAVELLNSKKNGVEVNPRWIDALEARWKKAEENRAVLTKMVMNNFMLRTLAALRDQPEPDLKAFKSVMEQ